MLALAPQVEPAIFISKLCRFLPLTLVYAWLIFAVFTLHNFTSVFQLVNLVVLLVLVVVVVVVTLRC